MKTKPDDMPVTALTPSDWAVLQRSRPEDYDGHTEFARMSPAARLAWLDTAVEFVSRHARRPSESTPPLRPSK